MYWIVGLAFKHFINLNKPKDMWGILYDKVDRSDDS